MAVLSNTGIRAGASGVVEEAVTGKRSTRLNSGGSAYLNWTPGAAGNRKTWTWSGWVKRSVTGTNDDMFKVNGAAAVATNLQLMFHNSDFISVDYGGAYYLKTDSLYRDVSAWYHIVLAVDTTQATDTNRMKLYVNGSQVTSFDQTNYPTQNDDLAINSAAEHLIGGPNYFDGYIADIHFIDGTAKAPTDFGETNSTTGQWVPKDYSGSYGTNGFHLAMDTANGGTIYSDNVSGTVWSSSYDYHYTFDGLLTTGSHASAGNSITWTPPSAIAVSSSLKIYAGYAGSGTLTINGSDVTSQLTSNTWSTISGITSITNMVWSCTDGSNLVWMKGIQIDGSLLVDHTSIGHDSSGNKHHWHENNLFATDGAAPSKTLTRLRTKTDWNTHRVSQIKINGTELTTGTLDNSGSVWTDPDEWKDGNADSSNATYSTAARGDWFDVTLASSIANFSKLEMFMQLDSSAGSTTNIYEIELFFSDGTSHLRTYAANSDAPNQAGAQFNSWQWQNFGNLGNPGDISILADVPGAPYDNGLNGGGNYATLNALDSATTLSNGNLTITGSGAAFKAVRSTIGMKTGKWYFEGKHVAISSPTSSAFGIWDDTKSTSELNSGGGSYGNNYLVVYDWGGNIYYVLGSSGTIIESGSFSYGDVVGFALDLDNGTLKVHKNGTYLNSGNSIYSTWPSDRTYFFGGYEYNGGNTLEFNFGQRAFAYTPPDGYKSLNTYNLPDPTITKGNTGFDTKLYDGNSGTQTITGLGFSPDLVWIKDKSATSSHWWYDTVRGTQKLISSNYVGLENWAGGGSALGEISAFTSDGFTIVNSGSYGGNASGSSFVAWNWDAGSANVSKSAGSLNSSAYNQEKNWSTYVSAGTSLSDAAKAFDGVWTQASGQSGETARDSVANGTVTFDVSSAGHSTALTGSLEVYGWVDALSGTSYTRVDVYEGGSGSPSAQVELRDAIWANKYAFVNVGTFTNITKIIVNGTSNGGAYLGGVKVAGKELIDTSVTPTNAPSLATTYRANPNTGFSVVSYTGVGNTVSSVAHGLNTKPDLIIIKDRDENNDWAVYHSALGETKDLCLNTNAVPSTRLMWNNTPPTSSVFTIGAGDNADYRNRVNDTNDYIAFCWSEVSGYSRFGTYEGNNNAAGPFVWCGFKPALVMLKNIDATQNWVIVDNTRDPDNVAKTTLRPNSSLQEYTNNDFADFLSNGFKFRGTEAQWNNSETYVFAAFAESPFKYSNAR